MGAINGDATEPLKNDLNEPHFKKLPMFHPCARRFHILLLMMIGFFTIVSMRINLGIAITCMINSTAITLEEISKSSHVSLDNGSFISLQSAAAVIEELPKCSHVSDNAAGGEAIVNDYGGTLVWDNKVQGWLFSSIFYGSLITIIPGGYLADTKSPKTLATIAALLYIFGTSMTPVLAVYGGWLPLFFARVIMGLGDGLVIPSINKLITFWIPTEEKSTAATIYSTGFPLASILGVPTFAYLCSTSLGWPAIFYGCAILGTLWVIAWQFAASKSPFECKFMLDREKIYLKSKPELIPRNKTQKVSIPYRNIFTSLPFYSLLLCSFSLNLVVTFLHSYQPTFFKEVLFLSPINNGIFGAIPPLMEIVFKFAWSIWMDKLKQNKVLHPTTACKLSQGLSGLTVSVIFVLLAYLPDCETPLVTLVLFAGVGTGLSFCASGFFTSMLSIAPLFTGLISSATMVAGIIARIITPSMVAFFIKTGTLEEWKSIFFIIAGTTAFSTLFFVLFSAAEVQYWAVTPAYRQHSKLELEELKKENEAEVDNIAAEMLP